MPLPLLRINEKLTVHVLRTFGMRELLAISILSKRAGKAVKLLKLRSLEVNLYIGNFINFELIFNDPTQNLVLEFYNHVKRRNTVLNIPKRVTVTSDGNEIEEWKFPSSKMTMKDWYYHIEKTVDALFWIHFEFGFTIFNFESIKKTFQDVELKVLSIAENIPNNRSRMILEEFLPISHGLELRRNPFQKKEDLRAILIQNQEFFSLGSQERFTDFTLNDMLICKFALLSIQNPTWTDSDLNRFLKLCIKGACPNLCQLEFCYLLEDWRWNSREVLKGISYKEFTGDRGIGVFGDNIPWSINGGYDIQGMDGRICSIEVVEPRRVNFWFWGLY
ncbi:unnamed protein product [Caenorhabditis brenneri]